MSNQENNTLPGRFCDFCSEPTELLSAIGNYARNEVVSLEKSLENVKKNFPQLESMLDCIKRKCRNLKTNLSQDEAGAIMLCTLEWAPNENQFYSLFNQALRNRNRRALNNWEPYLNLIVNALLKLPTTASVTLYRAIPTDCRALYSDGNREYIWWSFSSCTTDLDALEQCLEEEEVATIFELRCKNAIDVTAYSFDPIEKEYILLAGRPFSSEILKTSENRFRIILTEKDSPSKWFLLPQKKIKTINIVFCGEENVGKSTLISGLVNYLNYSNFSEAMKGNPINVVPFSLTLLSYQDFELFNCDSNPDEKKKMFAENRCQSYLYTIPNSTTQINLINTPSFDPEENETASEIRLRAIVECIKTLDRVNGLCFVLKSNESKLRKLPYCFKNLIEKLGVEIVNRIFFCFTNIFSTFYTIGSANKALRMMFQSPPSTNITLSRSNCFLFENSPFQMFTFLKTMPHEKIPEAEEQIVRKEWDLCVQESHRFIKRLESQM